MSLELVETLDILEFGRPTEAVSVGLGDGLAKSEDSFKVFWKIICG